MSLKMSSLNAKSSPYSLYDRKVEPSKTSECGGKSISFNEQAGWINPVHGYIYQLKILMLFLHRGLTCKYSFRLGTEIKEAKKFDDLVFEYVKDNKKFYRLLQAKHKFDESKKITVDKLLTETRGDYSLVKYFYSFKGCKNDNFFKDGVIKDVIICTNIDFDFDDLKKSKIEIVKLEEKDDILDVRSNEKVSTRYKFTNSMINQLKSRLRQGESDDDIECFVKCLTFAVNQPNEEELGQIIKQEIGKEMSFVDTENAYNKLFIKMMELSLGKKNNKFLSHEEGRQFFADLKKEIPIWFNVREPVMSFTGRLEFLKRIHYAFTKKLFVCISGMGGVGKTELVRKYIADYGDEYDNQVVWINSENYRSAADSFRQLASDKLNISLNNADGKEKHISCIVSDVYQFFSKGKSLFILDNAEKYKCKDEFDCGIDQFLPRLPDNCVKPNIIITSRNQKWPQSIEVIVLDVFKVEEAREFVEKMLIFESDEEKYSIVELGKKLQFLPLALQQAVAYIKMQNEQLAGIESNFGIGSYLEIYSNKAHDLLDFNISEDSDSDYDKSVFFSWNMAFDNIKEKANGTDALTVLQVISYFLPEDIPITLLSVFAPDKEKLNSAIGLLKQYSLISRQYKTISVHRLVQQVTRIKMQKQNEEVKILKSCLDRLLCDSTLSFKTVDHAVSIWSFASKHNQILIRYLAFSALITTELRQCGRIEEAIRISNEALLKASSTGNSLSPNYLLAIKHNLALCIVDKGEYETALVKLQEVQEFQKKYFESTHDDVITTKSHIVWALCKLGRNREALKYCKEVLDTCAVKHDETHPDVLLAKTALSEILIEEGKHEEALLTLQEIYRVTKRTFGDRHKDTWTVENNIAMVLNSHFNKTEESLEILEKVCGIQESILPKTHPDLLHTKYNIARALTAKQSFKSALKMYKEIFEIKKETLGEHHPDVLNISVWIAVVLKLQGKYEEALNIFMNAFAEQHMALGPTHPQVLETQREIADTFIKQKRYTDALEVSYELLDKQMSFLGQSHPRTLGTQRLINTILVKQKKYDAALAGNLEVLNWIEKSFGKDHHSTLRDKTNVGCMYIITKNYNEALNTLTQLLEVQESTLGKDHIDCQETRNHMAKARADQIKYDQDIIKLKQGLRGTDINKKFKGCTMLHCALYSIDKRAVEFVLQQGADIFITNDEGETPLHVAVLQGQETFVKMLLQRVNPGRLKDFVDAKTTSSGFTALHIAVQNSDFDIVKCLLKNHATFCAKNNNSETPLDLSIDSSIQSFFTMIHELFDDIMKADASAIFKKLSALSTDKFLAVTNTRNDQGFTLAQVALKSNQKQIASQILQMLQNSKQK